MIRVAILGARFMGATHAAGWQALGRRARVTTVCARTAVHGRAVAQAVGAAFSTDLDSVLADPDVDAVDICLPTPLHRSATERALGAGKHVLLEKPIALTLADAEAIARTAAKSDRVFMVALVLRFFPEYAEIDGACQPAARKAAGRKRLPTLGPRRLEYLDAGSGAVRRDAR